MEKQTKFAVLVITGASGAGKTTLTDALRAQQIAGVVCVQCDRVYDEFPEELKAADGPTIQETILTHWLNHLLKAVEPIELAVLETQIRPHHAQEILARFGVRHQRVLLVECEGESRNARLCGERGQPELATHRMECWAAYLHGQADALRLPVIDTTDVPLADSLQLLREQVDVLLAAKRP